MTAPDPSRLLGSQIPPQIRAMMSTGRPATPQESLETFIGFIELFAARGPAAANGLKVVTTRDEHGATIRIDLP